MRNVDASLVITAAGVIVALFIGGMQVYIAFQQKTIANQQAQVAQLQGETQAISGWLPFLKDQDPTVRYLAVNALERIRTEAVIAPLATALSDSDELVRKQAASALSKFGTDSTINILVDILGNQDRPTVNAAIHALQKIGHKSLPKLQQALVMADPVTRSNAQRAIDRILLNERALDKIGALASHEQIVGVQDIVVAILGAGVDQSVSDIKHALIQEIDHAGDGGAPGASTTMAARLIVGHPDSDIVGVAPGVRLISERVLSETQGGSISNIIKGILHAVDAGANVIYLELGGAGYSEDMQRAVNAAHSAGCLVVAAAGNSNDETKHYPAALENVLAVAATDADDRKAAYSSYGNWVDISAPGNPIDEDKAGTSKLAFLRGTSFSGSLVAGAAALVWSVNPSLSAQEVETALLSTADDIGTLNPDYRNKLGRGRVNVTGAINKVQLHSG
jgi:subtilisin family serine protease